VPKVGFQLSEEMEVIGENGKLRLVMFPEHSKALLNEALTEVSGAPNHDTEATLPLEISIMEAALTQNGIHTRMLHAYFAEF
jgi:hypothetical protein